MRWPEGPPHLALNPPYFFLLLFFVAFFCSFPFFVFHRKTCFPPKSASLSFSLAFLGLPLFHFHFLCLSFFISSFLLVFRFFLSFCFSFLSDFSFFFLLCFCFMKGTTSKYSIQSFCSSILSYLCCFPLFFSFKFPFIIFAFLLIFSFVFCSSSMFFFKKCKFKKHLFWVKRGLQHNVFFFNLCFAKCEISKLSFLLAFFCQFLVAFQKTL